MQERASAGIEALSAGDQDYGLNDTTNAEALVAQHGDHIRYVEGWGWLVYDGKRWNRKDGEAGVLELAKATVKQMFWQAGQIEDGIARGRLLQHANASLAYPRLRAMVNLAATDPSIRANVEDFNTDPMLLNVQNGTIDLRTGDLREHSAEDMITQLAGCDYEPDAHSDLWEDFVRWAADGREDLRDYIQKVLGYSLTGQTGEKGFFLCYGPSGDNGKSTMLEAVLHVLGDYGTSVETDTVLSKAGASGGIPNDLAALAGMRFVVTSEPMEGRQFRMDRIKKLTGGDTITARFLNQEFFTFRPVLKLWLTANNLPAVPESGNAAWRRVKPIPFDANKPKAEQDPQLGEKFKAAAPAILAWLVKGCLAWQQEGLQEPACMTEARDDYRADQDPFSAWVAAMCDTSDPHAWTPTAELLDYYKSWYMQVHRKDAELSATRFNQMAAQHGFAKSRRNTGNGILGLQIGSAEEEAAEAESGIPQPDITVHRPWAEDHRPALVAPYDHLDPFADYPVPTLSSLPHPDDDEDDGLF